MDLRNFFDPKSIAILGASPEEGKVGNVIARNVLELGYAGQVYPVNPKYDEMFGRKCYRKLSDIQDGIDLVIASIPSKFVVDEIRFNADRFKNYVIVSSGFSEIGGEGKAREDELKQLAQEKGLSILGPNCLGFLVPSLDLNASFASGMPEAGNVAFISQSGALAVALMDSAKERNLKFSYVFSVGNKAVLGETDLLEYLADDPKTSVIAMYLEGISEGERFLETARKVSRKKPIVVLKAGKTEKAQKAISSHTGALAGSDEITAAAFRKSGILRAESLEEFFEIVSFVSLEGLPKTGKVVVVTNAGGAGVLSADAFLGKKAGLYELSDKSQEKLRKFLPEESSLGNPIDLLGDAQEDRYKKTLALIDKEEEVGAVLAILTPQGQTPVAKVAGVLGKFKDKSDKAVTACFIGGEKIAKGLKKLAAKEVPTFAFPENAVRAIDAAYAWNLEKNGKEFLPEPIDGARKARNEEIIRKAKAEGRTALYYSEAKAIMESCWVKCAEAADILPDEESAYAGPFPAVLKVDSDKVLHKTDRKGVVVGIADQEKLKTSIEEMKRSFPGERLIVQPMLEKGTELIVGIKKDPVFGPVIICGLGGIYAEALRMVDFFIPPFGSGEIESILAEGRAGFMFRETRGQKPYDLAGVAAAIRGVGDFAREVGDFAEFDINPLIVYNDGKAAVAVDVKIIL